MDFSYLEPAAAVAAAGAGLAAYGAMHPAATLYGPTLRRTGSASSIALTFDDGPNPAITPALLDLLDRSGARATFFVVGQFVRECRALTGEIAARGHLLGNHTDTHPSIICMGPRPLESELRRCQEAIGEAAGAEPRWMRPPYGFRSPFLHGVLRQMDFHAPVMWRVSANDWLPRPPEYVVERLRAVRGGDIVLMHDGDHKHLGGDRTHTVRALEHWLPRWRDAGLAFVRLDDPGPKTAESGRPRAVGA
jgi:peptidoglycan/xylan/chitin deacetylase (PgdA/CDA1 family)